MHEPTEFEQNVQAAVQEIEGQLREAAAQFEHASEEINRRSGRNLFAAIGIGLLLGGLLLVSLLIPGWNWLFILFGGALVGFTVFELASAIRVAGRDVPRVASLVVALAAVPAAFFWHVEGLWLAVLAGILLVAIYRLVEQLRLRTSGRDLLLDLGAGAFVQVYVTLLGGLYVALVGSGGQWWVLAGIITVVAIDTGAYATGLAFGRHKLAPTISPGKTWEGFGGAAAVGIAAGVLLAIFMLQQPWWVGALFGVALLAVGTMGDLIESLIKRDLGIKDISSWLPGHGGFLDRLDSLLPSAAVVYLFSLVFR